MRRREFIILCGAALSTWLPAQARQAPHSLRVGYANILPKNRSALFAGFAERMTELGYAQGRNFDLQFTYIPVPTPAAYQGAFQDIAERKVDIIFVTGPEIALKAAIAAAGQLPVVMVAIDYDPISLGYVGSLARPAGNVTGLSFQQIELTAKRIQLIQQVVPHLKAVAVFWDRISADQWRAAKGAAQALGLRVLGIELRGEPYDFDEAFAKVGRDYRGGLVVLASPAFAVPDRKRLADFTMRHRLPCIFINREYAAAGGLLSYGPSFKAMGRRAAEYVDRIAHGAQPGELPIERPTQFELVVNLRTAKALGIAIPEPILLRADEVIE